ncbi:MSMEG_0569 family flavin-dependent oxidoreductase [Pelagicoccus sp. SDUM812003]|uniref:MSMEG_0569 family flavin-dependent oxidoreductase n=1 Tax=Pelagicoccus sp. SDUM812003 TaxID=3041267 RepID=UPI00280C7784|nr:MSMEG_0569 family flavin-dependent oxidoreductase [Pelagicoccus sp. SDUM812003]MDQ8202172.1 MSMEG_0569 family flavin-dependent oxidoreductase [Pelagicoccus sp. SDUM812003]
MKNEYKRVEVVIIGGGQAGLSVSYQLSKYGVTDQVIFEKNRVAHSWREERWDSFCLVTPNFQCRLPEHPYDGDDPDGFMLKDEIVDYVERFAQKVTAPIHEGVTVLSVRESDLGYEVETSIGTWICQNVVSAIGSFHIPMRPEGFDRIPSRIQQIFATEYRNPEQIPQGAVAIVGNGQSGCQIAEDLQLAGRQVHLYLGNAPRSPRKYRGKDAVAWLEEMGYYETCYDEHPDPEKARGGTNHYLTGRDGGREIDLRRFALDGMKLYGYLEEVTEKGFRSRPDVKEKLDKADRSYLGICQRIDDYIAAKGIDAPEEPPYVPCWTPPSPEETELDFETADISCVIWCLGFKPDFSFIEIDIFDRRGLPEHKRGVTEAPGLFFLGLPWLHTWGSSRFAGIAEDATHIAQAIVKRRNGVEPWPALQRMKAEAIGAETA